jgi:hypothetical protein
MHATHNPFPFRCIKQDCLRTSQCNMKHGAYTGASALCHSLPQPATYCMLLHVPRHARICRCTRGGPHHQAAMHPFPNSSSNKCAYVQFYLNCLAVPSTPTFEQDHVLSDRHLCMQAAAVVAAATGSPTGPAQVPSMQHAPHPECCRSGHYSTRHRSRAWPPALLTPQPPAPCTARTWQKPMTQRVHTTISGSTRGTGSTG